MPSYLTPEPLEAILAEPGPIVEIKTELGVIRIKLRPKHAPQTVESFIELAKAGFHDGLLIYAVEPNEEIWLGDPATRAHDPDLFGTNPLGTTLPREISLPHAKGAVAVLGTEEPDYTRDDHPYVPLDGTQFRICIEEKPEYTSLYTVFGHVVGGLEVARDISRMEQNDLMELAQPVEYKIVFLEE